MITNLARSNGVYDVSAFPWSFLGCNKRYKTDQSSPFDDQSETSNGGVRDASDKSGLQETRHVCPTVSAKTRAVSTRSDFRYNPRKEKTDHCYGRSSIQVPYSPANLLDCFDDFFSFGPPEVREWLVEFISKHFFEFMRIDGVSFADKLKRNPDLSNAVFRRLHEPTKD